MSDDPNVSVVEVSIDYVDNDDTDDYIDNFIEFLKNVTLNFFCYENCLAMKFPPPILY